LSPTIEPWHKKGPAEQGLRDEPNRALREPVGRVDRRAPGAPAV